MDLNNFVVTNANQSLWLDKSNSIHDGRYTCQAENAVGAVQRSFVVKVEQPPLLEGASVEEVQLLTGDHAVLQCRLRGGSGTTSAESIRMRWEANGHALEEGTELGPSMVLEQEKLIIRRARLSDTGEYACIVENEAGQARKLFRLTVNGEDGVKGT